jgi:hypothetical protein
MENKYEGLPKYVVNFDELTNAFKSDLLGLINNELKNKYPQLDTHDLESMLEEIRGLLPYELYKNIKTKIDNFVYKHIYGMQKAKGIFLDVPPLIKEIDDSFQFDKDVYLTGLHINQTGWKKEDRYSLEINKNKIINNATTKELGEHKYFNTFFQVLANTPIVFTLDNKSGNSRQTLIDLEYIESLDPPLPPLPPIDPNAPGVDDIPNDWDIAVVMNWEENSSADIDLHGFIGNNHVYFSNTSIEGFYLNFDFTNHLGNTNPEIISIKGYSNQVLDIYAHDYNGALLTHPLNIKIYGKEPYGNILIKEMNVDLSNDQNYLNGICSIDINTKTVIDLNNKIRTINGGI